MTTTKAAPFLEQEDADVLAFGKQLLKAAATPREKAAVWALVEERKILTLPAVRRNLASQPDSGGRVQFTWQHLACSLYGLGLDESGRAFLDLILSIAWPHQTSLMRVLDLDERRLTIVLQAMTRLAGNDTITITARS
jgi:hypothetical protein